MRPKCALLLRYAHLWLCKAAPHSTAALQHAFPSLLPKHHQSCSILYRANVHCVKYVHASRTCPCQETHLCRPRKAAARTGGCRAPHPGSTCLPHTRSLSAGPLEPHSRRCQRCACSSRERMTSALSLACTVQYVQTRQQHMAPCYLQVHILAMGGTAQHYRQALAVQDFAGHILLC